MYNIQMIPSFAAEYMSHLISLVGMSSLLGTMLKMRACVVRWDDKGTNSKL